MATTKLAAGWTQEQPEAEDLGRVIVPETPEAGTAIRSEREDDVHLPAPQVVGPRSRLLGAHGGLDRILMVLIRRLHEAPTSRALARASADRLHETIRALSAF